LKLEKLINNRTDEVKAVQYKSALSINRS